MKQLKISVFIAGLLLCFSAMPVQAQGVWGGCEGASSESAICADESEATDLVETIVNTLLIIIGALSVIMIIHSGLKYTISHGDAEMIKSAKNTLLYAVIGLVIALSSYAIVNFVIDAFSGTEESSEGTNVPVPGGRPGQTISP